jgi:AcrR family transcriptional regulator
VQTAYELFQRHGFRAVGIDRIVAEADVSKSTLYRHFRSKDELVLAILELRQERWTRGWLKAELERRGATPEERLLAAFDAFDEWFHRPDFEGCLFIRSLLESGDVGSPVGAASAMALATVRSLLQGLVEEAGVRNPDSFALRWQLLLEGAIVMANAGRLDAAVQAKEVGRLLLANERASA